MARPKKTSAPAADGNVGTDHNAGPPILNDDQRQALAPQHLRKYEAALARKKETAASFLAVCKLAKAELGDDAVDVIKEMILARSDEGVAELQARIERAYRAARWMAVPLGAQVDMFDDRVPAVDRARAEGKRDRFAGKPLKPPYDSSVPQYDAYAQGWHDAGKELSEAQKRDDAVIFEA